MPGARPGEREAAGGTLPSTSAQQPRAAGSEGRHAAQTGERQRWWRSTGTAACEALQRSGSKGTPADEVLQEISGAPSTRKHTLRKA